MPSLGPCYPRPVADAPVAALADGAAVAKAWLVELIAAADLEAAAGVPVAALAAEGPGLCAALVAALGSDAAVPRLAELAPGAGALAGATDPAGAVAAVEALRRGAWACLAAALPQGEHVVATDLALRLGHVAALVAVGAAGAFGSCRAEPAFAGPVSARGTRASVSPEPIAHALGPRLLAGPPFAVLLVELDDLDRLLAAGVDGIDEGLDRAGRAIGGALSHGHEVVAEGPGRWWAIVPPADARELAGRVASAIAGAADHRGVPLTASVGLALSPEDGATAAELRARAEEGVFAARAAGAPLAPPT